MKELVFNNDKGLTIELKEDDNSVYTINIIDSKRSVNNKEIYFTRVEQDALDKFNEFKKLLND